MNILIIGGLGHNGSRLKQFYYRGCSLTYLSTFYFVESLWDFQDNTLRHEHFQDEDELYRGCNFENSVQEIIERDKIDIIYCILNIIDRSNEFTKRVIDMGLNIPIIRHYKEHRCEYNDLEKYALINSDGQIYENIESLKYFKEIYGVGDNYIIALGDPSQYKIYIPDQMPALLSETDQEIHVVSMNSYNHCIGRGNDYGRYAIDEITEVLISNGIHVHIYGGLSNECEEVYQSLQKRFPGYLHVHGFIDSKTSCKTAAQYDWGIVYSHPRKNGNSWKKSDTTSAD